MILRAKNWAEFQHYKDRAPAWIKLHKKLIDDRVYQRLPDASRALAPMLWLLCSESEDGSIKDPIAEISFRLRMTEEKTEEALNPLVSAGFFILEQVASEPLADCKQAASLEKRREETEKEERERGASAPRPTKADKRIPDDWTLSAEGREFAKSQGLDADRMAEAFKDYWKAATGSAAQKLDWDAAFRTWCRRQVEQQVRVPTVGGGSKKGGGLFSEPWEKRMADYRKDGFWRPESMGPPPGQPGCRVPREFLDTSPRYSATEAA